MTRLLTIAISILTLQVAGQTLTFNHFMKIRSDSTFTQTNEFLTAKGWTISETIKQDGFKLGYYIWAYDQNPYDKANASAWLTVSFHSAFINKGRDVTLEHYDKDLQTNLTTSLNNAGLKFGTETITDDGTIQTSYCKEYKVDAPYVPCFHTCVKASDGMTRYKVTTGATCDQ